MSESLKQKAKTLMEILEERNKFRDSISLFNVKNQEKWVRLSDALIYLGETETQFAEEVMKYKVDLERERGLQKQKLQAFYDTLVAMVPKTVKIDECDPETKETWIETWIVQTADPSELSMFIDSLDVWLVKFKEMLK